ncbi:L-fucose:H+ symporter permease [Mucilaginibacter sp. UR6-1]|uniref:L-fucose:H+ symporter permease n=1 Tax=Mucilaginibacter sp. UR6-1 TaxID=1435643 RepID=UPI001E3E015A|nr:L-fucose:H+ symporter permease [Mucilaginibacter sp. UR6-1]MCC8410148.1 L-fucose:H+ symporter permease [Mucilaginibacter sp. UR6-1]
MDQKPKLTESKYLIVFAFVTSLFMLWGIAITMGDVLNKHFQTVLNLSKSQSAYVQVSIFGAYAFMGIPAGLFMKKFGYKNGVLLGLFLYAVGAFLFVPAAGAESFTFFRIALFILACGLATLETVAHPFVAALGDQRTSDQRINFAQSFNGVGAILGPSIGSYFILRGVGAGSVDLTSVKILYVVIGSVIALIGILFSFVKVPPLSDPHVIANDTYAKDANETVKVGFLEEISWLSKRKHYVFAVVAQLFNVGAQGGTWAFFINYGEEVMGFTPEKAGYFLSLSMVMLMVGRFIGTVLMSFIAPNKLLAVFASGAIIMCIIASQGYGWASYVALIMINFFFSIMFPTIFSLGLKDLGKHTEQASSFIVMGVVGGALFPPIMGLVANTDVAKAYYLPIICYAVIGLFGFLYPKLNKNIRQAQ